MAVVIGLLGDATLNDGTTAILRMLMARAVHTGNPAMATAIRATTAAVRVITMAAPASDLASGQAAGK